MGHPYFVGILVEEQPFAGGSKSFRLPSKERRRNVDIGTVRA